MGYWLWTGNIGEDWAFEFQRQGLNAIIHFFQHRSQCLSDLDDTMGLCLDVMSKESVHIGEEVVDKLARGHLDVLVDSLRICYTMTAIDTHLGIVKGVYDVNIFTPPYIVRECTHH